MSEVREQIVRLTTDGDETKAEVVGEIVRCKDCKLWHYDDLFNEGWCVGRMREPDYFCADGKRKDGKQDVGKSDTDDNR